MAKILVIVDMQNDFIDGSLGTAEAQAMLPVLIEKIKKEPESTLFIMTADTHSEDYMDTPEGKKLPVKHCIKGTYGWEFPPSLTEAFRTAPVVIEKPTFGSFDLIEELKKRIKPGDEIEFTGLCTDICVVSNAIMAKAYFYDRAEIYVDPSCCAGVTPESHRMALETMKMCQINIRE